MNVVVVKNLSKKFIIPHVKKDSIRENVFNLFSRRSFEEFFALENVDLTIQRGEFIGVVGRNGSGKSTLLKILAGVYYPSNGDVYIKGNIVPFLELGVGFNPELTGRENVFLNASILGMSEKEILEIYDEVVEFAELERFMDQKLKNYSSGMQVRLAFSIAMKVNGDVYLMDEVLAVGDSAFQVKCFEKFRELKKQGKTLIFVSHDLDSIRRFCDRVLYLKDGKVVDFDYTDKVLDRYIYEDSRDYDGELRVDSVQHEGQNLDLGNQDICKIIDLVFENKNGDISENFVSGDSMKINVKYEGKKDVKDVVVGIAIYKDDEFIYGTNSYLQGKEFVLNAEGTVSFFVEKLNLIRGQYYLTVALHSKSGENYHWIDKGYSFNVKARNQDAGFVDLNFKFDGAKS